MGRAQRGPLASPGIIHYESAMADNVQPNRRLAAILVADVVGYSRLMAADEAGTLAALKRHRQNVFDPAVARHNGRVVKLIGDGPSRHSHRARKSVLPPPAGGRLSPAWPRRGGQGGGRGVFQLAAGRDAGGGAGNPQPEPGPGRALCRNLARARRA
jgi:hypothetical protein